LTAIAQSGVLAFGPQPAKGVYAHDAADPIQTESLIEAVALNGSAKPLYAVKSLPGPAYIVVNVTGGVLTGDIVVHGTIAGSETPTTEIVSYSGDQGIKTTTHVFTSVTGVDLPAGSGKTVRVGTDLAALAFRHRAADIDLSALDDVRLGPPEVGGIPTPTFPYKGGQLVTGGATLYPRLENSFLWLLWAALGYSPDIVESGDLYMWEEGQPNAEAASQYLDETVLAVGAQTGVSLGTPVLLPEGEYIAVMRHMATDDPVWVGDVTIHGTDVDGAAQSETLTFTSGSGDSDILETSNLFATITSIDVPAYTTGVTDTFSVGSMMFDHVFTFNPGEGMAACLPWMSFYKFIPSGACVPNDPDSLWEMYKDCKVLGLMFTLPNDSPIAARVDTMGRTWELSSSSPFDEYLSTYEDYQSIPVGCHTGGYFKLPSYSATELPIVSAQVGIANAPLDIRQEKVYGSPELDDITIVSRALTVDLILKWKDPELYREIYTGRADGTVWDEKPFVQDLDILAQSNGTPDYVNYPYGLRMQAPSVLFQINNGVRLAGNQAVMLRMTGTALAPSTGDYCTFTLTNRNRLYRWPTA
jgi:hypothetical protein